MTSPIVVVALIIAGFFVGNLFNYLIGILEGKNRKIKVAENFMGTGQSLYNLIVGIFYFACLFSVPLSGNLPLFIMTAGMFLYALYGSFGREKLKPSKQEDKVITKWFSGFP